MSHRQSGNGLRFIADFPPPPGFLGLAAVLTFSRGEPQVSPNGRDLVIWFLVNAILGAGTALAA